MIPINSSKATINSSKATINGDHFQNVGVYMLKFSYTIFTCFVRKSNSTVENYRASVANFNVVNKFTDGMYLNCLMK